MMNQSKRPDRRIPNLSVNFLQKKKSRSISEPGEPGPTRRVLIGLDHNLFQIPLFWKSLLVTTHEGTLMLGVIGEDLSPGVALLLGISPGVGDRDYFNFPR